MSTGTPKSQDGNETTGDSITYDKDCYDVEVWPGNHVLPKLFRNIHQEIQDLTVYDDDVWVITQPKAGTHWMQETLCALLHGNDSDYSKLNSPSYRRALNTEAQCLPFLFKMLDVYQCTLKEHFESLERPRVMRTHLFWEELPRALRDPNNKAKIVYVARNPKDVFVSRYYFTQMAVICEELIKSLDYQANEFLNDRIFFGPYWTHVFDYWNRRDNPKILFVKYEEMKANFSKVLDRIQIFLNRKPLTEEQKQKLTDFLSFEKMKNNKAVNGEMFAGKGYRKTYLNSGEEASVLRKGQVGGWKKEMSPELARRFDEWIAQNTAGTDYSVDID